MDERVKKGGWKICKCSEVNVERRGRKKRGVSFPGPPKDCNKATLNHFLFFFIQAVCSRPLDLIFAVDVSGSIDNTEFTQTRTFISNVVAALVEFIGVSDSGVRIVVLGFDQEARFSNASRLDQPAALSIDGVRDQLTNLPYTHGATLIEEGLQAAADVFNTSSVRQNATRVVVVITDGVNYNGNSGLVQAAELLRTVSGINKFIIMFTELIR